MSQLCRSVMLQRKEISIHIKFLHKTFSVCRATLYHSDFTTLHVSAFIGHPQVFYLLWLKLLTRVAIYPVKLYLKIPF
jgi:hypothetical protein